MADLSPSTLLTRSEAAIAGNVDGTTVILNVERGTYCVLNGSGGRIFEILTDPTTVEDLCRRLTDLYAVDADTCLEDVSRFIERMLDRDLIRLG